MFLPLGTITTLRLVKLPFQIFFIKCKISTFFFLPINWDWYAHDTPIQFFLKADYVWEFHSPLGVHYSILCIHSINLVLEHRGCGIKQFKSRSYLSYLASYHSFLKFQCTSHLVPYSLSFKCSWLYLHGHKQLWTYKGTCISTISLTRSLLLHLSLTIKCYKTSGEEFVLNNSLFLF